MSPVATVRAASAVVLTVAALAVLHGVAAQPQATTGQADAVRATWLALDEAWSARDAAAFSRLFSESTSFAFEDRGEALEGRAAVLAHFEKRFPEIGPGIRHQTHIERISTLAPGVLAVDGGVHILKRDDDGRASAQILRRFSIFAVMAERDGGLEIRVLKIFRAPDEDSGRQRVVEIRSYNLVPGSVETFERLFLGAAMPLLDKHGIDVVAYGRSLHDENSWYLMRSFDDPAHRERAEALFYGSDEWREGPREAILARIESYTTVVLPFDEATVERLRQRVERE